MHETGKDITGVGSQTSELGLKRPGAIEAFRDAARKLWFDPQAEQRDPSLRQRVDQLHHEMIIEIEQAMREQRIRVDEHYSKRNIPAT